MRVLKPDNQPDCSDLKERKYEQIIDQIISISTEEKRFPLLEMTIGDWLSLKQSSSL